MANALKNKFYPYIEKYINEYLHGFTKERIDIELSKGEITLEKMSLRPDTINKIMDEKNLPFWIKVGLITKIYVGASVLSVIGEIPLELVIDGVDIILSPSYKWIINNLENYSKNNSERKDTPNPLGNDVFNKKVDDFDTSIFNIEKIQEIFKDKTVLSNVINNLFKSLYSFYSMANFVVVIKIKNVHLRFEDDELMNYTGNIALGLRVNLIQIKLGCKGNMKKDSIKLESLDIYWENDAKILISSNFLNDCIEDGKLQERYFTNLKKVRFERFQYLSSTKFIIQDFNFTINLGTRCENKEDIDIFDVKNYPSMVYFQLASNELNINVYPELAKISNNFSRFMGQFPIIEKVKDYHPFIKPTEENSMNYINIVENYRKNVLDNNNKKKMLVRDWINYFYWFQKSKIGERAIIINPIRTEFVRFYKICFQKVDIHEKKEEKKEEEEDGPKDGDEKKIKENQTPSGETPKGEEETPTPEETPVENEKIVLIPEELEFSSRIDLLIKGLNVNLHSPLNEKMHDYISLSVNGIEIKIKLSKSKFEFNFKIKTIDLGPSNLNIGQRVIIQPKSYRKAIPEQNLSAKTNYFSVQNTKTDLGSRITHLIKKYNPNHEEKIKIIDEALELAESRSPLVSVTPSENGDYKFKSPAKLRNKTPFGHSVQNLGQSSFNLNVSDLGKTYGNIFVPKNVSFAKNLIDNDNYDGSALQNKKYKRKKNNEINISQAINDYNSYKNQEKLKLRMSKSPPSSLSSSQFNLRESEFGIKPNALRAKNTPLNLLEIFSNTEVGAFSLNFSKYNNPVTLDNLSIQIGTIRLNMFANYLLDILRILSEYKKATNVPKITSSKGTFSPDGKTILEIQEYFYNYLLKKIPDKDKTDSMNEYMDYLIKEINSKKKFSSKPEHFALNQIFSFFPKGFDFHFDYENIEIVAYDKENVVSSKIIIPSNELIFSLTFTKIFVKLLELEIEIGDLNKCETILEQLKDLAKDKFKVAEIVLEPYYQQLKKEISPVLNNYDNNYKQIINNPNNNIPQNKQLLRNEPKRDEEFQKQILMERQYKIQKEEEERKKAQEQLLIQKQKEQQDLMLKIKRQKDQELLIQKKKENEQLLLKHQKEREQLMQKQKEALIKKQIFEQKERQKQRESLKRQQQLEQQQNLQNKKIQPIHQQNFSQNQLQQQLNLNQSNIQNQPYILKNQIPKNSKIPTTGLNSSASSINITSSMINQKIPRDNYKSNRRYSNASNNNNNLSQIERQISNSNNREMISVGNFIQNDTEQYAGYNNSNNYNLTRNFSNLNISTRNQNLINNVYINQDKEPQNSYVSRGNINQIFKVNNNNYNI